MTVELHDPGNEHEIDVVYAFMSIDADGRHGIVASIMPGLGSTPLVTGDPKHLGFMKVLAADIARMSGKRVGLFRFKRDEMIWEA